MLAGEIMVREVVTIRCGTSLAVAAGLLLAYGINAMPVLDGAGQVIGMIGIRDVLRVPKPNWNEAGTIRWERFADKANLLARVPVERVMARRVMSASEETHINDIVGMMVDHGVHPIPILRDGRLVGVIGRADVARAMLALAAEEEDARQSPVSDDAANSPVAKSEE